MGVLLIAVALLGLLLVLGVLNASGFFNALPLLLLLAGLSFTAYMIVRANFDPAWARIAAIAAPGAVLAWAAWRPALSPRELWVTQRVYKVMASVTWLSVLAAALTLPASAFHLSIWLARGWPWAALAGISWILGRLVRHVEVSSGAKNIDRYRDNL